MFILVSLKNGTQFQRECETLKEALAIAVKEHQDGTAWSEKIIDDKGNVIKDEKWLRDYLFHLT